MVPTRKMALIVAAAFVAASLGAAAPADADPGDHQCPLAVSLMCRLLPIAPGLDHDIDLTQGPGTLNGQSLPQMPENAPSSSDGSITDLCPTGCG